LARPRFRFSVAPPPKRAECRRRFAGETARAFTPLPTRHHPAHRPPLRGSNAPIASSPRFMMIYQCVVPQFARMLGNLLAILAWRPTSST
jgi:hypothetical protein